jgi:tetratricopeptide (TPR) repeat protein
MSVETLMEEAASALESGDADSALEAGRQLVELRHAYGFEVIARAHWQRDERAEAVRALEDGLKQAPHVWPLLALLGDYSAENGDATRARECYEQVLAVPNIDAVSRAHALLELGREDESIAVARAALAADPDAERLVRAGLHDAIAHALFAHGDRAGALQSAWDAIALHPSNEDAMWLIREIEQRRSPSARQYRLIVAGEWDERFDGQSDAFGFLVSYEVVADDPGEAKELVVRFEPEEVRSSLIFEDIEELDEAADLPKGVYWRSGYVLHDEE